MRAMVGLGVPETRPTVLTGADGVTRCSWATLEGLDLTGYHDTEWGRPTHDPAALFENLVLGYFEGGLSWRLVFTRREAFRAAFADFDPAAVAAMTSADVDRLLQDRSIVRNRAKIEATVHNAALVTRAPTLDEIAWAHAPVTPPVLLTFQDARAGSRTGGPLSRALRARGYLFTGPGVSHAFLQAVGISNGHLQGCFRAEPAGS
jgi:DNA-3-methyladenine glycosylase I